MVIRDGVCYADSPERYVKIVAAENVGDHVVPVQFDDGEKRLFDGRVLTGEVFKPLESPSAFANWKLDYQTLTWNNGDIDISADFVLGHSKPLEYPMTENEGLLRACEEHAKYDANP